MSFNEFQERREGSIESQAPESTSWRLVGDAHLFRIGPHANRAIGAIALGLWTLGCWRGLTPVVTLWKGAQQEILPRYG
jgi:hypothetical protein